MLKTLCAITTIIASTISFAETCPSIDDIKNNYFHHWQPFYIESGSPASSTQLEEFKNNVENFALAEWMEDAAEGAAHCYYSGKNSKNDYLNIYFANTYLTINKNSHWHEVSKGISQCRDNINVCLFM